ncbi:MAG: hypothetical protein FJ027_10920 [Candidatus Rokubacteria bacterium]|nr:hypothetical protein [Candidatus Rokubacteria bacterium]
MIAAILVTLLPRTGWGWVLLIAILLLLAVGAFLVLRAVRRRRLAAADADDDGEAPADMTSVTRLVELRRSFARSVRLLKANTSGRSWRYQIPWFLMVGETSSGKRTVLRNTGLNLPLGRPREEILGLHPGCNWWFFDSGVVLDVFGDYVLRADGGGDADARGWRQVLRLLRKHRPGRPVDGIILTIPATDLIGPHTLTPDHRARIGTKAEHLRRKLAEAQKTLGMRFPVYVLVTRCNDLRGFASFAHEVGTRRGADMFGWSTPYGLESAYTSTWVDEAFDRLYTDLHELELELIAGERPVRDGDGLFLFPSEVGAMREPVRIYLDALFKHSVYQESFFFRGVYFCGDAGTGAPAPAAPSVASGEEEDADAERAPARAAADDNRAIVFVKDFFERKVFPEYRLGRPAPRAFASKTRALLLTQGAVAAVALLGVLGLFLGYRHFAEGRRTLTPLLRETLDDVREAKARQVSGEATTERWFQETALTLLEGMANVSVSTTRTLWAPTSYFSGDLDVSIQKSLHIAYDAIIARSLHKGLVDRADRLVGRQAVRGPAVVAAAVPAAPAATPEGRDVAEIQAFLAELRAYEEQLAAYTGLRVTGDLKSIGGLVKYLYGIDLPKDFYTSADFYQEALKDVRYLELPKALIATGAARHLQGQVERMYARLFDHPEIREQVRTFVARVDTFDRRGRAGGGSVSLFRELLDTITQTEAVLARPEGFVLANDRLVLGPAWDGVLATVEQSTLLGPPVRAEIERAGSAHITRLRGELESQATAITGAVLERKPGQKFTLSSGTLALKGALEGVLNLKGAETAPKATPRLGLVGGERVLWDARLLTEAVQLYEQYEQFMTTEARKFPDYLEGFVRRGALRNLELSMMDHVVRAADVKPGARDGGGTLAEQELRQESRAFREATRPAARVLDILRQLGFTASQRDLATALTAQAYRILRDVDRVLAEDGVYGVKEGSIARWDGTRRLALTAFEVSDGKDLEQYLELQRDRVRLLARDYAEPLVSWVVARSDRRTPEQARVVAKWQRIVAELERYDAKKPGNSIAALERFILVDMDQITRRNYFQRISARDLSEESADFFLQKRNALRRDLYRRAQAIGDSAAATEYAEIESAFNRRLAGRFPFADPRGIRADAEVDLEAVREFYQVFDRYAKPAREVLKRSVRFAGGNDGAIDFLDQMDAVRTFLAPLLDRKAPAGPGFDLDIDFRVNREREVGGHQIIDWTMQVGEHRVRSRDAKRQVRWLVGDPIRVSLRWAKDYPHAPTSDGTEGVSVEDRTVTWDYPTGWSLLALLMRQAAGAAEGDGILDPRPTTLRFAVAMRPDRVSGAAAEAAELATRVYIRVVLSAGEKKDPLRLPVFPARAPQLTATARR